MSVNLISFLTPEEVFEMSKDFGLLARDEAIPSALARKYQVHSNRLRDLLDAHRAQAGAKVAAQDGEQAHASAYVDAIAPEHERTSCNDNDLHNAAYGMKDHGGHGRCRRCTLLAAAHNGREGTGFLSQEEGNE